jgi:hypothetical protein|tara:strand:+ start:189 stop:500 length:312 start_codon:yes stop_codon:yes gene_type:complete
MTFRDKFRALQKHYIMFFYNRQVMAQLGMGINTKGIELPNLTIQSTLAAPFKVTSSFNLGGISLNLAKDAPDDGNLAYKCGVRLGTDEITIDPEIKYEINDQI